MAATLASMPRIVNPSAELSPANTSTIPQARSSDVATRLGTPIGSARHHTRNPGAQALPVLNVSRQPGRYAIVTRLPPRPGAREFMATCPRCKGHLTDTHVCPPRPYMVV